MIRRGKIASAQLFSWLDFFSPHCPLPVMLLFRLYFKTELRNLSFPLLVSNTSQHELKLLMVKLEFSLKDKSGNLYES